jgi:hypothetical protein
MIVNKETGLLIDQESLLYTERKDLNGFHETNWLFMIPERIKDNHLKVIYKVGFLKKIYHLIDYELSNAEIFEKINAEWQVFLGVRQMERLQKKYIDLFDKKEES